MPLAVRLNRDDAVAVMRGQEEEHRAPTSVPGRGKDEASLLRMLGVP